MSAHAVAVADMRLRAATLDDAEIVADVDTEIRRDDPEDPLMLRHWWELQGADAVVRRYIAQRDGAPAGYAAWNHRGWDRMPERFMRVNVDLRPSSRTAQRLDALLGFLEEEGHREAARTLTAWAFADDPLKIGVLTARGFREERRQRFWELDLVANRERIERMAAQSRERMRREGITVTTLDRIGDPKKWERLKRMSDEAEQDVPTTVPHVNMPMAEWMKWFDSPALRHDRIWIALAGTSGGDATEDIVGISQLAYPPVRGVVATDWTGTARSVRGRGVARALKCETLVQAIALGVDRVRTDNDSQNAPILHINESMGYRIRVEGIQLLKTL